MNTIKHTSESRGTAHFGWLQSRHTFSFGRYYNPERVNFGALRVLNDDIVTAGMGFGAHPHDNMEIVSIPLSGDLEHKDSTGNTEVIRTGDVQIMSAGHGLTHSEYNHSKSNEVNFLQIWVLPKERDIEPRYQQITFSPEGRKNQWQTVVAPDNDQVLWINQDSWFSLADLDARMELAYALKKEGNGVYVFVIEGEVTVNGEELKKRDALGITGAEVINFSATKDARLLLIEVPMIESPF
ncbi:pirin family protein [Marinoscillum sp. 108]|uniref:pirin family protein n=1 Tax=Marinoscillum sp. 108 TaxID=2653151 RepID=UPI0012F392F5|nr:pirin family protein [Marinoscillum sp. 108]VXD10623.1 Quercetin 2,3-dioxygenase [Marinoscillum sp. 108]